MYTMRSINFEMVKSNSNIPSIGVCINETVFQAAEHHSRCCICMGCPFLSASESVAFKRFSLSKFNIPSFFGISNILAACAGNLISRFRSLSVFHSFWMPKCIQTTFYLVSVIRSVCAYVSIPRY